MTARVEIQYTDGTNEVVEGTQRLNTTGTVLVIIKYGSVSGSRIGPTKNIPLTSIKWYKVEE